MNKLEITRFPPSDYAVTEALNTLCTNLSFAGEDIKRIVITSCRTSEGKSYLAMNIVRTLASLGKRALLVDADLRRSQIGVKFGLRFHPQRLQGLSHYLAGMCEVEDVVYTTDIPKVYMVPAGCEVMDSLSLLNTPRFSALLDQLAADMDVVIVDAPPIGVIIDAAEIAKSCDGALFAVSYNKISRKELTNAKKQIEQTGCRVLGCVLNNVEMNSYANRRYYHKYGYSKYHTGHYKPRTKANSKRELEE